MKRKLVLLLLLFCLALLEFIKPVFALDVKTHKAINESIAKGTFNGFSLNIYLKANLGIQQGIDETVYNNTKIGDWLKLGGEYEDNPPFTIPYRRSVNHFHNPLTDLGYSGIWGTGVLDGVSSIKWALSPPYTQDPGGFYSWYDVRGYYYLALTSTDKDARSDNFAQTFRGLGQLMHLIQDLSVPEHTRDDEHPFGGYESWVVKPGNVNFATISAISYGGSLQSITNLFDTNQYTLTTDPNSTLVPNIGLAEYTGANFLSWDSMFTLEFPYPSLLSVEKWTDPTNNRQYLKKPTEGVPVDHLAVTSYLYFYRERYFFPQYNEFLPLGLDSKVYSDYATLLLPRAVGYSAGLINYFFRGEMEANGGEIRGTNEDIAGITVDIKNITPNETMDDGIFIVSYRHKPSGSTEYTYGLSDSVVSGVLTYNGDYQRYTFTFAQSIPKDATDRQYLLVFQGRLGNENGAVVGKIIRRGWWEEWDKGLKGNHSWLYTDIDLLRQNSPNGETINEVTGGMIIKENIRYAESDWARVNETLIQDAYQKSWGGTDFYCTNPWDNPWDVPSSCFPYDFGKEFPIPITKDTWVSVEVDDISINTVIPYQDCGTVTGPGAYQGIIMGFDNGINLAFTVPGQEPTGVYLAYYIEPGKEMAFNIFDAFKAQGVEFTEPVNLKLIHILQQLWDLCEPSDALHHQRMVVDYIRIEER